MTFSITWGLLARMDGIVSAEHFNVLYRQPQFYSSSTGTTLKGHGWILASSPEDELRWIHGTCIMVVIDEFIRCPRCQSVHESSPESRVLHGPMHS